MWSYYNGLPNNSVKDNKYQYYYINFYDKQFTTHANWNITLKHIRMDSESIQNIVLV